MEELREEVGHWSLGSDRKVSGVLTSRIACAQPAVLLA
jgi:hypothetical protein